VVRKQPIPAPKEPSQVSDGKRNGLDKGVDRVLELMSAIQAQSPHRRLPWPLDTPGIKDHRDLSNVQASQIPQLQHKQSKYIDFFRNTHFALGPDIRLDTLSHFFVSLTSTLFDVACGV
jgi:hypothetical protein